MRETDKRECAVPGQGGGRALRGASSGQGHAELGQQGALAPAEQLGGSPQMVGDLPVPPPAQQQHQQVPLTVGQRCMAGTKIGRPPGVPLQARRHALLAVPHRPQGLHQRLRRLTTAQHPLDPELAQKTEQEGGGRRALRHQGQAGRLRMQKAHQPHHVQHRPGDAQVSRQHHRQDIQRGHHAGRHVTGPGGEQRGTGLTGRVVSSAERD